MTSTVTLIDQRFKEAREAEEKPRRHLGASVIGRECSRQIWYGFRWFGRPDFSGRMYRLFERGAREEAVFCHLLRRAGVEIYPVNPNTGDQFSISDFGGHFGGSMDGAAKGFAEDPETWHVVEMKTHNDKSFQRLKKEGVINSKPEHHAQMQVYMHYTGMKKAAYIAVNKNDDEIHIEFVDYNEPMANGLVEKARTIISADAPPERIGGPDWWVCKFCDFRGICHQDRPPLKNCRTCKSASADLETGGWSCAEGNDMTPMEAEKPCHEPLPK